MSNQARLYGPNSPNQGFERRAKRPTILLYDDDEMYLNLLAKTAKRENMQVRKCMTLKEFALEVARDRFDLAIVDYWLEDNANGCMIAKITQKPVLLISSNPSTAKPHMAIPESIVGFMDKNEGPRKILKFASQTLKEQRQSEGRGMEHNEQKKYILIDDDDVFTAIMQRCAAQHGISLHVFSSIEEMGHIGMLGDYDGAIVDYDLGTMTGVEIGEYLSSLFDNLPMILISAKDRSNTRATWPPCVRGFLTKEKGYSHIIEESIKVLS